MKMWRRKKHYCSVKSKSVVETRIEYDLSSSSSSVCAALWDHRSDLQLMSSRGKSVPMQMYTIQQTNKRFASFHLDKTFPWLIIGLNLNLQARHLEEIAALRIEVKQLRNSQQPEDQPRWVQRPADPSLAGRGREGPPEGETGMWKPKAAVVATRDQFQYSENRGPHQVEPMHPDGRVLARRHLLQQLPLLVFLGNRIIPSWSDHLAAPQLHCLGSCCCCVRP